MRTEVKDRALDLVCLLSFLTLFSVLSVSCPLSLHCLSCLLSFDRPSCAPRRKVRHLPGPVCHGWAPVSRVGSCVTRFNFCGLKIASSADWNFVAIYIQRL